MFNSQLNAGLLFNHLSEWLLIASKAAKSNSDLIVKLARLARVAPNITHDHRVPRNIRKGIASIEDVYNFIGAEALPIEFSRVNNADLELAHGWYSFKCIIDGLKQSSLGKHEHLNAYWQFLEAHCELESNLLLTANKKIPIELSEKYLADWLRVDNFKLPNPDKEAVTIYVVRLIMYWAAIFELFLEIEFESDGHSILKKVLPTASHKENHIEFSPTSEKVLEGIKLNWAKDKYGKSKISWEVLYKDILRRQMQDPVLTQPPLKNDDLRLIEPDISAIKKQFFRWREGNTLFSLNNFRAYLAILHVPFSESEHDLRVAPYVLINLFTHVQNELLKSKADPFLVVKTFSKYEDYKSLVKIRYDNFCTSGILKP